MTVAALPNFKQFVGNGSTGPFTFAFTFDSNTELSVTVAGAGLTTLSPAYDYTVSGAGSSLGGSITLTNALAVGSVLTVTRTLALEQDASLPNQGPFFSTTVEFALDRIVKMIQQLYTLFSSAIFITAVTSPSTTTFVNADASGGGGGTGIDGGVIGATVQYSGSGLLTVVKNDSTQYLVAVLPPAGWTICGRSEYDLSVGGESASFYPGLYNNLNRIQ